MAASNPQYPRPPERQQEKRALLHPRRVRGGRRLMKTDLGYGQYPEGSAAARFDSVITEALPESEREEAFQYARAGQTKSIEFAKGGVRASIQGRGDRPYETAIELAVFAEDQWERVIAEMASQARYAAAIVDGRLSQDVVELFESLGLPLIPPSAESLRPSCTCGAPPDSWCKHAGCLGHIAADQLAREPLTLLALRGLRAEKVVERLREHRGGGEARNGLIYSPVVRGVSDASYDPLDACLERFWTATSAEQIDLPVDAPELSHPLLRRLGSSPFSNGKFPLVGLLATCYDIIGERVLKEERGELETGTDPDPDPDPQLDAGSG